MSDVLTHDLASHFARIALAHIRREYPNKLDHAMNGPEDVRGPRDLHPIFYGSFDWHSCVHGYWLLARVYRRFPEISEAEEIRALFDEQFVADKVKAEVAYLARPFTGTFERPYGWAWLLELAAELARSDVRDEEHWSVALAPLDDAFAARFLAYLPNATYPVRSGAHYNSAFAVALALDYAETLDDHTLADALRDRATAWFGEDADCQAWEPGGEDFLSPALMEAECMRRVLPADAFTPWLDRFLPRLEKRQPATLFTPAVVSDRSDGKIAHLDGLNLSRAWCLRALAKAVPPSDHRATVLRDAARAHLAASLPHVAGDYMGEHWLASFALLALEA